MASNRNHAVVIHGAYNGVVIVYETLGLDWPLG